MTTPPPQLKNDSRFTVASLLSPPEMQRRDSFASPMSSAMSRTPNTSSSSERSLLMTFQSPSVPQAYASPPISPCSNPLKENVGSAEEESTSRAPVLFEPADAGRLVAPEELDPETESAITQHIASNDALF